MMERYEYLRQSDVPTCLLCQDHAANQLPLNSNIATTGHKLQGMSKLMMVVTEWGSFPNWIYVVLSRVTTRAGLFLLKPLTKRIESFVVSKELLDFESKMQELENNFIARIELKLLGVR